MSRPLIDLKHVSKIYPPEENPVYALRDVSLSINSGELIAIVGTSGSGKSTLMNIIGCLDLAAHGTYHLSGQEVSHMSDQILSIIRNQQIGFIFQGFNLVSTLTAAENVELPLIYRGMPREQRKHLTFEALERVGLADRLFHRPSQMSGGQQQRVAIARAIAARPPIILADEPTGNLDSDSGAGVLEILNGLWQEGRTVILITHDEQIAAQSNRVIRVQDGQITMDTVNKMTIPEIQVV